MWAADDDLDVVKRAVQVAQATEAKPAAPRAASRKTGEEPRWLKIKVVEQKDGKKNETVSITVPLGILRALGDDVAVDLDELGVKVKGIEGSKKLRLGEVLAALEPGQPLVEVHEENSDVRIWVE